MVDNRISVDAEKVKSVLSKVNAAHESPGIPAATSFAVQAPPSYNATSYFNSGMTGYVDDLAWSVANLRTQLASLHDEIKETVEAFAARDAAVADAAAAMMSSIDSGATTSLTHSYTPGGSNPADSAASTSGY